MITGLDQIGALIGNTPLMKLHHPTSNFYAKLEYTNFSGSVKDRAAFNILRKAILGHKVDQDTTIVESSSGNFALALAGICQKLNLTFIPVIDHNINKDYERLLRLMTDHTRKVDNLDVTGGFLLSRLERVKRIVNELDNVYWPNQYENKNNYMAYYDTLGAEICEKFDRLDYIFLAVSSGGTITGLSMKLKERFPNLKVVAVDLEGSVIFGGPPKRRYISGIGSSIRPKNIEFALIDDLVMVSETEVIEGCRRLLNESCVFAGGSSGAVFQAVQNYATKHPFKHSDNVLVIFPDKGHAYLDTIYNSNWCNRVQTEEILETEIA